MISTALMKEQLKRFWFFMPLSLLAYALFVIFPIYIHAGGRNAIGNIYTRAEGMLELLSMSNPVMLTATVAIPLIVVMLLFAYLFNPKATTTYYALTDSKHQLYWTSFINGLILIVVPLLILSLFLLIRVRMPVVIPDGFAALEYPSSLFSRQLASNAIINTFPVILGFFLRIVVSFVFIYALFLLAVTVSGNWVAAGFIFGLLPMIPLLLQRLIILIGSTYVFGFYPVRVWSVETIISYSNPLAWAWNWGERAAQPVFFLIYIGITIALMLIANACFVGRKIEKAEDTVVFSSFKSVLIFSLSVIGMITMGGYLMSLLSGRWFMYYGFVLGFLITFCITQMIFSKTFNIIPKMKWILPSAGVVGAFYGIMLLVTMFFMGGYTHHVPAVREVAGVHISANGFIQPGEEFYTDSETIEYTVSLHRQIVRTMNFRSNLTSDERKDLSSGERRDARTEQRDNRRNLREAFWQSITGGGNQFRDNGGQHLYITYRLNNGDRIYRRYALSGVFIKQNELIELFMWLSPSINENIIPALPDTEESVEFEATNGTNESEDENDNNG